MFHRHFRSRLRKKWSWKKKLIFAGIALAAAFFIFFAAIIASVYQAFVMEVQKEKDDAAKKNNYENAPLPITIDGSVTGNTVKLDVGGSITVDGIKGKIKTNGSGTITFTASKKDDSEHATLTGTSNAAIIWRFLMQHGYSAYAASGLMGCWQTESHFDPSASQGDMSALQHGKGIAQWSGVRTAPMVSWVTKHYGKWNSLAGQLAYFIYDSKHDYKLIGSQKFKSGITNLQTATAFAMDHYEQRGSSKYGYLFNPRFINAQAIYAKYHKFTGGLNVELTGKIKGNKVTISGTINGITAYTEGTYKDGKIKTSGYWGEGADDYMNVGSGVRGMLKFAKRIVDDNSYGYSLGGSATGYNTYCHLCNPGSSKDYCCASFITACINHGLYGKKNKTWARYCKVGSKTVNVAGLQEALAADPNFKRVSNSTTSMKAGDICIVVGAGHVVMYAGQGKTYEASDDHDGRTGDSSGTEIHSNPISMRSYQAVYRYVGKDK